MLSASGRFAVPEKILKRSSFTTLALRQLEMGPARYFSVFTSQMKRLLLRRRCGSTEETRGHKSTSTSALHFTNVPVARECLANKGLIVRKPNSGSARHRWAQIGRAHV